MSRILVVGAGGIGGYVTAVLAAHGADVVLMARGENGKFIERDGLRIDGGPQAVHAHPVVVEKPGPDDRFDVVMVATKSYDSDQVLAALGPNLADDGIVVMLQNGVDRGADASRILGRDVGLDGVVYLEARLTSPGVVTHFSGAGRVELGDPTHPVGERAEPLAEMLRSYELDVIASEDPKTAAWRKMVLVSAANALTGATGKPFGAIVASELGRSTAAGLLSEGCEVAKAEGAALPEDFAQTSLKFLLEMGPKLKSSMLHDVERGRQTEVDILNGTISARGRLHGVPTPRHDLMVLVLGDVTALELAGR